MLLSDSPTPVVTVATFRPPLVCLVYAVVVLGWLIALTFMIPMMVVGWLQRRNLEGGQS
jgi:hypothetical protein